MIMVSTLNHPDGEAHIAELPDGRKRITVKCVDDATHVPKQTCETSYPQELIEQLLNMIGPAWLCETISRYEDPQYVKEEIRVNLFAFLDEKAFIGKRLLDFGCGAGASTICCASMLPETEIVGVELSSELVSRAQMLAQHYKLKNVKFCVSPEGTELPASIGDFDFCMMSAVYEHLLPEERTTVLPKIWSCLKPGGALFINQTPHRYYPIEAHSTGLPLINYFPDNLTFFLARRMTKRRPLRNESDYDLLRGGIRGGTEYEIKEILEKTSEYRAVLLEPHQGGYNDRIDLWYSRLNPHRWRTAKLLLKGMLKTIKAATGTVLTQNLTLAIQKDIKETLEPKSH